MKPHQEALEIYRKNGWDDEELFKDLMKHISIGYVHSTPLEFVLFRPVSLEWGEEKIVDMGEMIEEGSLNCWHVTVAVCDLKNFRYICPYYLPYMSYEKKGKFRVIKTDKFYE